MNTDEQTRFDVTYTNYLRDLTLQGKADKTIEAYSRAIRQLAQFFDCCPDNLTTEQLKQYFYHLAQNKSWSAVKIARNAIQFLYKHLLNKPWQWVEIIKPPKVQTIQSVLTLHELELIINATRKLRYQTYFLVTYSLGLRLSEALNLQVADIDSHMMRVHIRKTKSKKDRFVPLPQATLLAMRRYWKTHRHPTHLFPGGKPPHMRDGQPILMDKGGVQKAIKLVAKEVGISKNVHIHTLRHSIATHMLERGMSLRSIQTFLGHANPDTTAKYTRMTQELKQCSALMLNDLVDSLAIVWREHNHDHA